MSGRILQPHPFVSLPAAVYALPSTGSSSSTISTDAQHPQQQQQKLQQNGCPSSSPHETTCLPNGRGLVSSCSLSSSLTSSIAAGMTPSSSNFVTLRHYRVASREGAAADDHHLKKDNHKKTKKALSSSSSSLCGDGSRKEDKRLLSWQARYAAEVLRETQEEEEGIGKDTIGSGGCFQEVVVVYASRSETITTTTTAAPPMHQLSCSSSAYRSSYVVPSNVVALCCVVWNRTPKRPTTAVVAPSSTDHAPPPPRSPPREQQQPSDGAVASELPNSDDETTREGTMSDANLLEKVAEEGVAKPMHSAAAEHLSRPDDGFRRRVRHVDQMLWQYAGSCAAILDTTFTTTTAEEEENDDNGEEEQHRNRILLLWNVLQQHTMKLLALQHIETCLLLRDDLSFFVSSSSVENAQRVRRNVDGIPPTTSLSSHLVSSSSSSLAASNVVSVVFDRYRYDEGLAQLVAVADSSSNLESGGYDEESAKGQVVVLEKKKEVEQEKKEVEHRMHQQANDDPGNGFVVEAAAAALLADSVTTATIDSAGSLTAATVEQDGSFCRSTFWWAASTGSQALYESVERAFRERFFEMVVASPTSPSSSSQSSSSSTWSSVLSQLSDLQKQKFQFRWTTQLYLLLALRPRAPPRRVQDGSVTLRPAQFPNDRKALSRLLIQTCGCRFGGTEMIAKALEAEIILVAEERPPSSCGSATAATDPSCSSGVVNGDYSSARDRTDGSSMPPSSTSPKIIGFACATRNGWIPFIGTTAAGEGIGAYLLYAVMECLRVCGVGRVRLTPLDRASRLWYDSYGFAVEVKRNSNNNNNVTGGSKRGRPRGLATKRQRDGDDDDDDEEKDEEGGAELGLELEEEEVEEQSRESSLSTATTTTTSSPSSLLTSPSTSIGKKGFPKRSAKGSRTGGSCVSGGGGGGVRSYPGTRTDDLVLYHELPSDGTPLLPCSIYRAVPGLSLPIEAKLLRRVVIHAVQPQGESVASSHVGSNKGVKRGRDEEEENEMVPTTLCPLCMQWTPPSASSSSSPSVSPIEGQDPNTMTSLSSSGVPPPCPWSAVAVPKSTVWQWRSMLFLSGGTATTTPTTNIAPKEQEEDGQETSNGERRKKIEHRTKGGCPLSSSTSSAFRGWMTVPLADVALMHHLLTVHVQHQHQQQQSPSLSSAAAAAAAIMEREIAISCLMEKGFELCQRCDKVLVKVGQHGGGAWCRACRAAAET